MIKLNYLKKYIAANFESAKQFADAVGLSNSYISLLLRNKRDVGVKAIACFRKYCKTNDLKFSDFIELD